MTTKTENKRFFIPFLSGPTTPSYLAVAWITTFFSIIFYTIIHSFFDNPSLAQFFLVSLVFSVMTLAFYYLTRNKESLAIVTHILISIHFIYLLFCLDFMSLLMFLSGFGTEKNLNSSNHPYLFFSISIAILFLLAFLYFGRIYLKENSKANSQSVQRSPLEKKTMSNALLIFGVISLFGSFITGKVASLFGILLALLCTIVFAALICDSINAIVFAIHQSKK